MGLAPDDPCRGCAAACCRGWAVPLGALDLLRLVDGLGEPWRAIAAIERERTPLGGGFRLDRGTVHHRFVLQQREGACRFLRQLPDGARCAVHPLRPSVCRAYPFVPDGGGVAFGEHAVCPEERGRLWRVRPASGPAEVADADAARALDAALRDRWDELARTVPAERPLAPDDFLAFAARARAALAGAATENEARERIAALPLPA